jgi:hypothetical protein
MQSVLMMCSSVEMLAITILFISHGNFALGAIKFQSGWIYAFAQEVIHPLRIGFDASKLVLKGSCGAVSAKTPCYN